MEITREEVKRAIYSDADILPATTIADIIKNTTHHVVHIIYFDDMSHMMKGALGKVIRAIGSGIVLRTCQLKDYSCRYFFYDETAGVARTAWHANEFIDNLEAFAFFIGHHPKLLKKLDMSSDMAFATLKFFGEGTTYTPPVYKKVDFDYFEKVGRHYGLDDDGIAHAKILAKIKFNLYKGMCHENDRVISVAANMHAIESTLNLKISGGDFASSEFNSDIEFVEDGGFAWFYKGFVVDTK